MPSSDPRGYITPDAFRVAPHLLGLPLASPSRRAVAMLLDLLLVAVLVHVGGGVLFGLAAAVVFFKMASGRLGSRLPRPMRGGLRLGGALLLFVVGLNLWSGLGGDEEETPAKRPTVAGAAAGGSTLGTVIGAAQMVSALTSLEKVESREAARSELDRAVKGFRAAGVDDAQITSTLREMSTDAENRWAREASRELLATLEPAGAKADTTPALSPDALAHAWANAVAAGDSAGAAALRPRLVAGVAADTLSAMQRRVAELERERTEARQARTRAQEEVARLEKTGLLSMLGRVAEELGLEFGWTGLYFTAFLAFGRGQTPGKRLLGMRVVRLDGKPMTLWASFERFGGYAASIFTGLMGFIQILWDRNRQGMHDKIVETVVVRLIPGIEELTVGSAPAAGNAPPAPPVERREAPTGA